MRHEARRQATVMSAGERSSDTCSLEQEAIPDPGAMRGHFRCLFPIPIVVDLLSGNIRLSCALVIPLVFGLMLEICPHDSSVHAAAHYSDARHRTALVRARHEGAAGRLISEQKQNR